MGYFLFDANNDGWVDLYNNNETAYGGVYNSLMLNNGDLTFSMSGPECGAVIANNGYGSAYSDLDQDGDLDIVLVGSPSNIGSVHLLRNDSSANNWIVLRIAAGSEEFIWHWFCCRNITMQRSKLATLRQAAVIVAKIL